jgi:hypothetical protein
MGIAVEANTATAACTTLKVTAKASDCAISLVGWSATTEAVMTAVQIKYVRGCVKCDCWSQRWSLKRLCRKSEGCGRGARRLAKLC